MAFMSQLIPLSDTILLSKIPFHLPVGLDAWGRRGKPQPVLISLQISHSVEAAAAGDDVSETLDYGKLYKRLCKDLDNLEDNESRSYPINLQGLMAKIDGAISPSTAGSEPDTAPLTITIELPKASLRCLGGLKYSAVRIVPNRGLYACSLEVQKINCACIVGVNPHERREKQDIYVSLEFRSRLGGNNTDLPNSTFIPWPDMEKVLNGGYQTIIQQLCELVAGTGYETIESLASFIAKYVVMTYGVEGVTVSIEKPSAIALVEASGVRLTRNRAFFEKHDFWQIKQA